MSLVDFYNEMTSADIVDDDELTKIALDAAVEELIEEAEQPEIDDNIIKTAAEYDAAGRIMARAFFSEMLKEAQAENEEEEEEEKEEEEEEEKKKKKKKGALPPALAAALGEKKAMFKQAMLEDPEFAEQVLAYYAENE